MRSTKQMSITLPIEMAEIVASKVKGGEYASESEVIRDGIRALIARDKAVETWLMQDVAATYDAMQKNPASGIDAKEVRKRFTSKGKKD